MSCGVALAVSLLLTDPNIALAAALPPAAADAPVSVAGEPLFAEIVESQRAFAERVVRWDMDTNVNRRMAFTHYFGKKG